MQYACFIASAALSGAGPPLRRRFLFSWSPFNSLAPSARASASASASSARSSAPLRPSPKCSFWECLASQQVESRCSYTSICSPGGEPATSLADLWSWDQSERLAAPLSLQPKPRSSRPTVAGQISGPEDQEVVQRLGHFLLSSFSFSLLPLCCLPPRTAAALA